MHEIGLFTWYNTHTTCPTCRQVSLSLILIAFSVPSLSGASYPVQYASLTIETCAMEEQDIADKHQEDLRGVHRQWSRIRSMKMLLLGNLLMATFQISGRIDKGENNISKQEVGYEKKQSIATKNCLYSFFGKSGEERQQTKGKASTERRRRRRRQIVCCRGANDAESSR